MNLYSALDGKIAEFNPKDLHRETALPGKKPTDGEMTTMNLIGQDDRRVFHDSAYPWNINGYIAYKAGHNGSGILVGNRLVLTCYHCIDFDHGTVIKDFDFVPARYTNSPTTPDEPFGRFKVKNAYWWGDGRPTGGTNAYGAMDFAVLVLDKDTGLGYAGARNFQHDWLNKSAWYHIGYPTNNLYALKDLIQGRPTFQWNIKVMDCQEYDYQDNSNKWWKAKKVFTDADIEGGQSGGALFQIVNDIVMVSGVLGGQGSTDTGGAACADLMLNLIRWCRENVDK